MQKKGIVLKCQGNPVSCYGKRALSLNDDYSNESSSGESFEADINLAEKQEQTYEKLLESLIQNCKSGNSKSCSTMLKIMLMNSN